MRFAIFTVLFTLAAAASGAFVRRQSNPTAIQSAAAALNIAIAYIICEVANQALFAASTTKGLATPSYFDQCEQIAVSYPGFHGPKSRMIALPASTAR